MFIVEVRGVFFVFYLRFCWVEVIACLVIDIVFRVYVVYREWFGYR